MKHYLGIDPGKSGAIVDVSDDGRVRAVFPIPLVKDAIDWPGVCNFIYQYQQLPMGSVVACIEKVSAMPGQGVTSMFNFGFTTGMLHGILTAYDISLFLVTPQAWKKEVLKGYNTKAKSCSIVFAQRAYPGINLLRTPKSRTSSDGIADALCIALYAKAHY